MNEEERTLVIAAALEVALAVWQGRTPDLQPLCDAFHMAGVDLDEILAERAQCAALLPRLTEKRPPLKPTMVAIEGLK